jgi:hypothetical protein
VVVRTGPRSQQLRLTGKLIKIQRTGRNHAPRALRSPLRLRLLPFPSLSGELELLDVDLVSGTPVDVESRVTERVKAASRSYGKFRWMVLEYYR